MKEIFARESAERLSGNELMKARRFLVDTLSTATGISLVICGQETTIHCTDVRLEPAQPSWHTVTWEGFVGSTDYSGDGTLAYGAFLFPLIGGLRAAVLRRVEGKCKYDRAFRYLLLEEGQEWDDRGWQIDEFGEFEHWYIEEDEG